MRMSGWLYQLQAEAYFCPHCGSRLVLEPITVMVNNEAQAGLAIRCPSCLVHSNMTLEEIKAEITAELLAHLGFRP